MPWLTDYTCVVKGKLYTLILFAKLFPQVTI